MNRSTYRLVSTLVAMFLAGPCQAGLLDKIMGIPSSAEIVHDPMGCVQYGSPTMDDYGSQGYGGDYYADGRNPLGGMAEGCPPVGARSLVGGMRGRPHGSGPLRAHAQDLKGRIASRPIFGGAGDCPPGDVWANGGGGYQNYGGTCCGPHWWDFMAEGVFMKRHGDADSILMSDGIRGFGPPTSALATNDLTFNYEPAFRVGGRFQTSATRSLEAIYLGGLDWDDRITAFSANNSLYSAFSDFGNTPFGGFEDTDQASQSSLFYDSELDSVELNKRHDWTSPRRCASGSWLVGLRYLRIDEALQQGILVSQHFDPINGIIRPAAFTNYNVTAKNDLIGLQAGGEFIRSWMPGLTFGGEFKVGAFVNDAKQVSNIASTTIPDGINEQESDAGGAYMGQGDLFGLWQFHPLWKMRIGYEVLFVDGIATAAANYNSTPFLNTDPLGNPVATPIREVRLDDHDSILYHGFHLGVEFGW